MKGLFLIFIFLFISCNGGGGNSGSSVANNEPDSSIINSISEVAGKYNVNQLDNICINYAAGKSVTAVFVIEGNHFSFIQFGFLKEDCFGVPEYKIKTQGSVTLINQNSLSFNVLSEVAVVYLDSTATRFNNSNECGYSNWVTNSENDVSNTNCSNFSNSYFEWNSVTISDGILTYDLENSTNKLYPYKQKSIFSNWTSDTDTENVLNFGGENDSVLFTSVLKSVLSQQWLTILSNAGRDITGLVVGEVYSCNVSIKVTSFGSTFDGLDDVGDIDVDVENLDIPLNNACLELDNSSSVAAYNYNSSHIYFVFGDKLYIDYFGAADINTYGEGLYE